MIASDIVMFAVYELSTNTHVSNHRAVSSCAFRKELAKPLKNPANLLAEAENA